MEIILSNKEKKNFAVSGVIIVVFVSFILGASLGNYGAKKKARMQHRMYAAEIERLQNEIDAANEEGTDNNWHILPAAPLSSAK